MMGGVERGLPAGADDVFTDDERDRSRARALRRYRRWVAGRAIGAATLLVIGLTRIGTALADGVRSDGAFVWAALFGLVLSLVLHLVALPVAVLSQRDERDDGLSTRSWPRWVGDWAGGGLFAAVTAGLVAGAIFDTAVRGAGAFAEYALIVLVLVVAGPNFGRLFNRYRPVTDVATADRILALVARAGVRVRTIQVVNASKRTRRENAFVTGIGPRRRLVLFDTLLERADPRLVDTTVAHELGHLRAHDTARFAVASYLGALVGLSAAAALLRAGGLARLAGGAGIPSPAQLPLLLLLGELLELIALPAGAAWSRRREAAADRFALRLTGDPERFVELMRELATRNRTDLRPGRLARLFFSTHGTVQGRIDRALAFAKDSSSRHP